MLASGLHSSKSANNIAREQVANAVGSQIINVFIGLGLPYAIAGSSPLNTGGASTISRQPEATATLPQRNPCARLDYY